MHAEAEHSHEPSDGAAHAGHEHGSAGRAQIAATVVSGIFTAIGLVCHWLGTAEWFSIGAFAIATVSGGWYVAPHALEALRRRRADINLLMAIAVIGAWWIRAWNEAATVAFLFSLAELLESYSVIRAQHAIEAMTLVAPDTALVQHGDRTMEVPVADVNVDDIVVVRPGSRIPMDGVVISGDSHVNQAPITGESVPVRKEAGSDLFAGSINERGALIMRVTRKSSESTLARMLRAVEKAQHTRAPVQRFVDRFAHYYTPSVMMVAVLIAAVSRLFLHLSWDESVYRALVMLVIACPCALVIATPVSVVSALTAAARQGVLIKGGAILEELGKLRVVALDKTGTITEGRPSVTETVSFDSTQPERILAVAAALEADSEHPVGIAIRTFADRQGTTMVRPDKFRALPGRGVEGTLDGHHYFAGNHRLVEEMAVCSTETERQIEAIERRAQTAVVVGHRPHEACAGEVLGMIAVGDRVRPGAAGAVQRLHEVGIGRVVMLTGDNRATADAIAAQVGIREVEAELLPEEKLSRIAALMRSDGHVAMVGDGINDAPALATASVGIAMGAAGSDAAIETAHVALMADDLGKVPDLIRLGKRTGRIIRTNIALSLLIKLAFFALTIFGRASLWMAVAADTGVTLLVIGNSLRLLKSPSTTR